MAKFVGIDSLSRGLAMPKAYSGDLRERVIEAVETGASRREAAECFEVSVSSAVKWLQRWRERRSAAPKPRGGSISLLEEFATEILAVVAERPDLTLVETVAELRKRRIKTSRRSRERADVGCESKACLIPPGCCLSTRRRSARTWCGSTGGRHVASEWSAAFRSEHGGQSPLWPLCATIK